MCIILTAAAEAAAALFRYDPDLSAGAPLLESVIKK